MISINSVNYMALPGLKPGNKIYSDKSPEHIIDVVCQHLSITVNDIKKERRFRHIVEARQIAMFLIRSHTNRSLKAIAFLFGGKDHTTVIHSCQTVKDLMDTDSLFRENVTELQQKVQLAAM